MTIRAASLALVVITACAGAGGGGAGESLPSGGNISLRGGDRVVIPSMSIIQAIGIGERYVFLASPDGLGIYDYRFNEWLPPLTRVDGWPAAPVSVMLADPADPSSVWFAADNMVFHYRVGIDDIVRTFVPDRVSPASFFVESGELAAGVVVGGANGFVRVSPTGFVQTYRPQQPGGAAGGRPRITAQTVASVYARYPSLQNFERVLTRDASMRTWPVISAASSPISSEVWLGTGGAGAFKVDPSFARSEQVAFGLIGEGSGAVTRGVDGVWFGSLGNGLTQRGGVTFAPNDLRQWRWLDGGIVAPLANARITSLSAWEATLWVASDRGVTHLDARTGETIRRWDIASGLPSPTALAIEATDGGAWVGTLRGLVFVRDSGAGARPGRSSDVTTTMLTGTVVRALARKGDTLWIASDMGLLALPPGGSEPRRMRATDSRLSVPAVAVAVADSMVVFATNAGDVIRINTRTGDVLDQLSFVSAAQVGRIYSLSMDAATIWIAGERGVLVAHRASGMQRFLSAGRDLPADAFGVALTPQFAWIATRDGAVRLRRQSDGMVR